VGTKNDPGNFDCYANAEPDEPMFILLARDKSAPDVIDLWADIREEKDEDGSETQKVINARDIANDMREWRKANRPD